MKVGAFQKLNLEHYGNIQKEGFSVVLQRAFNDIDGKCLIIPSGVYDVNDINVIGKNNFIIEGSDNTILRCGAFTIKDCKKFEVRRLKVFGTSRKFAYFNIIGDCVYFSLHNCYFDSEKDKNGNNTFYGIHIVCDNNNNKSFENSPRNFKIYSNNVKNTFYDGILVHSFCSDFEIFKNCVDSSKCIGIEVEGRLGGNTNTIVTPCRNANIYNNVISNCNDWGILTMWVKGLNIHENRCKNNLGCFLSIGCKNANITYNYFEGCRKGFEISQEFYSLEKGINDSILVKKNIIIGRPRDINRGVLDIRHSKDIHVENNLVKCLFNNKSAMLCISSSQNIVVTSNRFENLNQKLDKGVLYGEAVDPETKMVSPITLCNIVVNSNKFDVK